MKPIRLLLVDDHALFRKGLARLLEQEQGFAVVGEAQDGAEAFKKAEDLKPDLVLMDIHMPGSSGIQATRQIREVLPATKVVILTVSEEDKDLFEAIKYGAHGYLLKKVRPEALYETIRSVFRGEAAVSRATAAKILEEFARQARKPREENYEEMLSVREQEVLRLLTEGRTNKEIGNRLAIAENTVKNHLKNILGKLHLDNRVQAATFALAKGIVPKKHDPE